MWSPVLLPEGPYTFFIGVPPPLCRRPLPSRHVPLALPAAGRFPRRNGLVQGQSGPRCIPIIGGITASITADSSTWHPPTRRPSAGRLLPVLLDQGIQRAALLEPLQLLLLARNSESLTLRWAETLPLLRWAAHL